MISWSEAKVVAVLPLVIPAALRAFTSLTARDGTSVKPEAGAASTSSPSALTTNTAASTRLIFSCVPKVVSVVPFNSFRN